MVGLIFDWAAKKFLAILFELGKAFGFVNGGGHSLKIADCATTWYPYIHVFIMQNNRGFSLSWCQAHRFSFMRAHLDNASLDRNFDCFARLLRSCGQDTIVPEVALKELDPKIDLARRTPQQQDAIVQEGRVIVSAGAGSGKTSTLVDKCLYWLVNKRASIDQLLVVTFTEAATGEMRRRMREGLEKLAKEHPTNGRIREHLDLFDTAHISTIHSFCLSLVKEHFHELGLDPRVSVIQADREVWIQREVMDELLKACYEKKHPLSTQVLKVLAESFSSEEERLRNVVQKVHRFAMTQPCALSWFDEQIQCFENPKPATWKKYKADGYEGFVSKWAGLEKKGTKFQEQDQFWASLTDGAICEDWEHCRAVALTLLRFAKVFSSELTSTKITTGQVSFDDLQQLALKLLSESKEVREAWRKQFKLIVVDEYQDVTPAQDKLIQLLRGPEATLFLVGDVKQSIYGFRLATPDLFKGYIADPEFTKFRLNANFRSHEGIIDFINRIFDVLMTDGTAQLDYKSSARLEFGNSDAQLKMGGEQQPRVEVHLLKTNKEEQEDASLDPVDQEAWIIGNRLAELKESNSNLHWHDMAVLLRSPKGKFEQYARIFHKLGIPVAGNAETFESSTEFQDLHALLSLIDNFRQDIPLAAVMHSPFGLFTSAELAVIRSITPPVKKYFWEAVLHFANGEGPLQEKVKQFLKTYEGWRELQTHLSINALLEQVTAETGYWNWIEAQPRRQTRKEFVQKFIQCAAEFEKADGRGLNAFLGFLKAQEELDISTKPPKTAAVVPGAVQIMSIHGSKGLEFPIVAIGDLGKRFNNDDAKAEFIVSPRFGIAGLVHMPEKRYPSVAHYLAAQESRCRNAMEELRLLYVAMTRAKHRLILCGKCNAKAFENLGAARETLQRAETVLEAQCYLKWVLPVLHEHGFKPEESGKTADFSWQLYSGDDMTLPENEVPQKRPSTDEYERVKKQLEWRYQFAPATTLFAKRSASRLKMDDDAVHDKEKFTRSAFQLTKPGAAAEIGSATHQFIENLDLACCADAESLKAQLDALVAAEILPSALATQIDLSAIADFWTTPVGREILGCGAEIKQELPFTFRISPADFAQIVPEEADEFAALGEEEFIIMQGVVDLAVVRANEIWILDFKTDRQPNERNTLKHKRQLAAYGKALEAIYKKPVTRKWLHYLATRETVDLSRLDRA